MMFYNLLSIKSVSQPLGGCFFTTLLSALLVHTNYILFGQSLKTTGRISTLYELKTNQDWSSNRCYSIRRVSLNGACPTAVSNRRGTGKTDCHNFSFAVLLLSSSDKNTNDEQQEDSDQITQDLADLKAELLKYLQLREEKNADEISKAKAGTIVGGSKGNLFLEYISAIPTTPLELEESYPFDYDELTKYGFSHCVKPIMQLPGGRRDAYKLMNMIPPRISSRLTPKKPREIKIDFEGKEDSDRYQGMRMVSDDDIAQQLEEIMQKKRNSKLNDVEEENGLPVKRQNRNPSNYDIPFSSNRKNKSTNRPQPEWTAEQLDEEGRRRGKTYDWARKVREEKERNIGKKDLAETIDVHGVLRVYAITLTVLSSVAYGKATPQAMEWINASPTFLTLVQGVALTLLSASVVSSIYSSVVLAPAKNRNSLIWAIKGFAGGPTAVFQLKDLNDIPRNI